MAARARLRLDVDERRAQLVELAIKVFSERSYDEVSIDDLAQAAGISKGLLYHYFRTKRDFYVAGLELAASRLLAATDTSGDVSPDEEMRRGIDTYLTFVERHGPAYVALMRGGIGSDPEVIAILDRTRETIVDRIAENMPSEIPRTALVRTALRGWIGFVEALAVDWLARPRTKRTASDRADVITLGSAVLFAAITRAAAA